MQRAIRVMLPLTVLLASCGPNTSSMKVSVSHGSTVCEIPEDQNRLYAAFHQTDETYDYLVLAYGAKDAIPFQGFFQDTMAKAQETPWTRTTNFVVGDRKVAVPVEGGVYVLDQTLKLHRTTVSVDDLQELIWSGNPDDLPGSKMWREVLYPNLKTHVWTEQDEPPSD